MSFKFNNQFAHAVFNEQVVLLKKPVRCLSFQSPEVLKVILQEGVYRPQLDKMWRQHYSWDYKRLQQELGYIPIWCYNPLQFGDHVLTTWNADWFDGATLWRRFIEHGGFSNEDINTKQLLEFDVPCEELKADVTLDSGFCSICKEIRKENLIAAYHLIYPDEDADNWFYPTIYPFAINKPDATFKQVTKFDKD